MWVFQGTALGLFVLMSMIYLYIRFLHTCIILYSSNTQAKAISMLARKSFMRKVIIVSFTSGQKHAAKVETIFCCNFGLRICLEDNNRFTALISIFSLTSLSKGFIVFSNFKVFILGILIFSFFA